MCNSIYDNSNPAAQVRAGICKSNKSSPSPTVFSYKLNKTLNKSDAIIADSTNAMRLTLQGEAIEKV